MTDNGGGSPGNRGSEEDTDSWFKPSENRFRTQSEYQDPLEEEGAAEGDAPAGGAVFPDSGGYAGLSASRPAMVEPYPDALGAPPVTPPAAPPTAEPSYVPGAISYPGAGTSAYQPVTRIPGDDDPLGYKDPLGSREDLGNDDPLGNTEVPETPETPEEPATTGGYPGIAASAQVPLPPEAPESPSEAVHDSWATGTNGAWTADAPAAASDAWTPGASAPAADSWTPEKSAPAADVWTPSGEDSWAPQAASESAAPPAGEPWAPQPAQDTWAAPAEELRNPEPAREQPSEWQGTGGLDSWSPAPDTGDAWKGAGTTEPWAEPATQQWTDQAHAPSYGGDRYDDELSPRPAPPVDEPVFRAADQYEEQAHAPSYGSDRYDDELSPASADAVPADHGGIGTGSGNTWAFDRNDPRLPDVVRDAERRRRESAPEEPEFTDWGAGTDRGTDTSEEPAEARDGGPDTGELSAAVATSADPLAAIADMQSRAKAKEPLESEGEYGAEQEQERDDRPWDAPARAGAAWDPQPAEERSPSAWEGTPAAGDDSWRGGEGATQMFTAPSFDQAPEPEGRTYGERAYGEPGYNDSAYDELGYDDRGRGEHGYGARGYDELDGPVADYAPAAPGVPSDLGSAPSYGERTQASDPGPVPDPDQGYDPAGGQFSGGRFSDDRFSGSPFTDDRAVEEQDADAQDADGRGRDEQADRGQGSAEEPDYEDGFTPADYGMPDRPKQSRRRRDRIADDFPGFEEAQDDGDYPGYDSIDFLADTGPGANATLWLGVASLVPGLGVITAILALFVTGPKAKKAIRESRGALDGLGLITTGTVFSVIGIMVTVISIGIWLAL